MEMSKSRLISGGLVIMLVSGIIGAKINEYYLKHTVSIGVQAVLKASEEQAKQDQAERDRFFAMPDRKEER